MRKGIFGRIPLVHSIHEVVDRFEILDSLRERFEGRVPRAPRFNLTTPQLRLDQDRPCSRRTRWFRCPFDSGW